jgi:hypothetical protein
VSPLAPVAGRRQVRLHFKVLELTDDQKKKYKFTPDELLDSMRKVYNPQAIDVVLVKPFEKLNLPLLNILQVDSCALHTTTPQQKELFAHRTDMSTGKDAPTDEICVYFLYGTILSSAGCASCEQATGFPYGRPAAVVTAGTTRWTLGHECGHVLGLSHVNPPNRVMLPNTRNITADPPVLTAAEAATMKASRFAKPMGP